MYLYVFIHDGRIASDSKATYICRIYAYPHTHTCIYIYIYPLPPARSDDSSTLTLATRLKSGDRAATAARAPRSVQTARLPAQASSSHAPLHAFLRVSTCS
ncbi:hypothetical protein M011DRAFT_472377 [Sporormia fimetaria CBS 119925]|uniref:Uncharacterized protein n=1 Tax=Sporormia fimetaria CBS 119925 TaxID=1340428 RepID=A0A6A6UXW2_9PLEO|nr:hypothetical protein M011DRAFT_472377 [Sporormia fimetaria CBS 119925]